MLFVWSFIGKPAVFGYSAVGFSLGQEFVPLPEPEVATEPQETAPIPENTDSSDTNQAVVEGEDSGDNVVSGEESNSGETDADSETGDDSVTFQDSEPNDSDSTTQADNGTTGADDADGNLGAGENSLSEEETLDIIAVGDDLVVVGGENATSTDTQSGEDGEAIITLLNDEAEENDLSATSTIKQEDPFISIPDFLRERPTEIKGATDDLLVMQVRDESGVNKVWLYNIRVDAWKSLYFEEELDLGDKFYLKENYIVWRLADAPEVFVYDLISGDYFRDDIPEFDSSAGERGYLKIKHSDWKIVFYGEELLFDSEASGEVYPDNDAAPVEAFREKFQLDAKLAPEAIDSLGLVIIKQDEDEYEGE